MPDAPYPGHVMQLAAYCHLVEQAYHVRPAYGVIRYDSQEFQIPYSPELERELGRVVQEMQAKVVEAQAQVPLALAEAFRSGRLGVMDYYKMENIQADTAMRGSIAHPDVKK